MVIRNALLLTRLPSHTAFSIPSRSSESASDISAMEICVDVIAVVDDVVVEVVVVVIVGHGRVIVVVGPDMVTDMGGECEVVSDASICVQSELFGVNN